MRYVPTNVTVPVGEDEKTMDTWELVAWMNRNDALMNSDGEGIRASVRIDGALEKAKGKPFIELGEDDWRRVCKSLDTPQPALRGMPHYPLHPARSLAPLIDAVKEAKEEWVEEKPPEEASANGHSVSAS